MSLQFDLCSFYHITHSWFLIVFNYYFAIYNRNHVKNTMINSFNITCRRNKTVFILIMQLDLRFNEIQLVSYGTKNCLKFLQNERERIHRYTNSFLSFFLSFFFSSINQSLSFFLSFFFSFFLFVQYCFTAGLTSSFKWSFLV